MRRLSIQEEIDRRDGCAIIHVGPHGQLSVMCPGWRPAWALSNSIEIDASRPPGEALWRRVKEDLATAQRAMGDVWDDDLCDDVGVPDDDSDPVPSDRFVATVERWLDAR